MNASASPIVATHEKPNSLKATTSPKPPNVSETRAVNLSINPPCDRNAQRLQILEVLSTALKLFN